MNLLKGQAFKMLSWLIMLWSNKISINIRQVSLLTTSSSRMHVMNHNWSATKQRLHPQSVAELSRHTVLSRDRIQECGTQGHSSVSVSRHFLLQAPQCPCFVRKWFTRDHCCRGRSKPGCGIVGSHTSWELTTWANFRLCLHRFLMSTGCKSSHNGFLAVSRSNGGLRISGWGQITKKILWQSYDLQIS